MTTPFIEAIRHAEARRIALAVADDELAAIGRLIAEHDLSLAGLSRATGLPRTTLRRAKAQADPERTRTP